MGDGAPSVATRRRLPRGRHGLSREEVEGDQRLRILVGVAEAMADGGYVGTPVAAILRSAGVSRETFYRLFPDKHTAYLAAFDLVGGALLAELDSAIAGPGDPLDPLDRVERGLDRYLSTIAEHRAHARLFLVESYAAGADAIARRHEVQERITDALAALLGARSPSGRFACQSVVATVSALIVPPLVADDADAIAALAPAVLAHVRRLYDAGVFAD